MARASKSAPRPLSRSEQAVSPRALIVMAPALDAAVPGRYRASLVLSPTRPSLTEVRASTCARTGKSPTPTWSASCATRAVLRAMARRRQIALSALRAAPTTPSRARVPTSAPWALIKLARTTSVWTATTHAPRAIPPPAASRVRMIHQSSTKECASPSVLTDTMQTLPSPARCATRRARRARAAA